MGATITASQSSPTRRLRVVTAALTDIKLAHSVFALPFALLGAFLAKPSALQAQWGVFVGQLLLIVACMFFARTWAMLINRLADRRFDAANPRTSRRAIASGRVSARQGLTVALLAGAAFIMCCALFWIIFNNPWPAILCVPTLAWIAFYSFTKRFTALAHVFLGGALAVSPLAAAIAVRPEALAQTPALWLIAGFVLLWVAGFDIAYALQDLDFDRESSLYSVPAKVGMRGALWLSRLMHLAAAAFIIGAAIADARFGVIFSLAVAVIVGILLIEHLVLARRGLAGLPMAFFTLNGIVSCVLGAAGITDLLA